MRVRAKFDLVYEVKESVFGVGMVGFTGLRRQATEQVTKELERLNAFLAASEKKEEQKRNFINQHSRISPWLYFTGWMDIFQNMDLSQAAARMPDIKTAKNEFPELVAAM